LDIENLNNSGVINITNCLALVCTSSEELVKDKCSLARDLWELNIGTDIFHEPIGSINVPLVRMLGIFI
jgi:hypothetical protein